VLESSSATRSGSCATSLTYLHLYNCAVGRSTKVEFSAHQFANPKMLAGGLLPFEDTPSRRGKGSSGRGRETPVAAEEDQFADLVILGRVATREERGVLADDAEHAWLVQCPAAQELSVDRFDARCLLDTLVDAGESSAAMSSYEVDYEARLDQWRCEPYLVPSTSSAGLALHKRMNFRRTRCAVKESSPRGAGTWTCLRTSRVRRRRRC
jgi:hypothetical protein